MGPIAHGYDDILNSFKNASHSKPTGHLNHNLSAKRPRRDLLEGGQQEVRRRAELLQERLSCSLWDHDTVVHGLLR